MEIIQDVDSAIRVMRDAGKWMKESGKNPSKWWDLKNLNKQFLLQYAKQNEFYAGIIDGKPAVAAILQIAQNSQDWKSVDMAVSVKAMYIHWLCVAREFAGHDLPEAMVNFAMQKAKEQDCTILRVDTNAKEVKLRSLYEKLGFVLVAIAKEEYRETAFYEKKVN